jgi:hypothetical protein
MRRISTASADRGAQIRNGNRPESVASWSWYSNSEVDLMLMSRKRANSFELVEPHPSTMLKAIDSAALVTALRESLLRTQLTTTDNCPTKTLITQNLDPLSPISNSPSGALAGMR